jgi:hypothetical protein
MSYSTDLCLTTSHRRIIWSITSSQLSAHRRTTHRFISVSERTTHPTHWLPHLAQGHTTFHLRLREESHTHLMGTPNSWASSTSTGAHNVPSSPQRGTTHRSHGHTQLMGSLLGRLTQFVSSRMSYAAVIINRAEEVCKGSAREIAARWARLSLHYNPLRAIIPGREPNNNNKAQNWFSRKGFSRGAYPNLVCNVMFGF